MPLAGRLDLPLLGDVVAELDASLTVQSGVRLLVVGPLAVRVTGDLGGPTVGLRDGKGNVAVEVARYALARVTPDEEGICRAEETCMCA